MFAEDEPKGETRPAEEGGHKRVVFSLDKRTRDYLAGIPPNRRSEVVENAVYIYSLVANVVYRKDYLRPKRGGRRRKLAKIKRI